MEYSEKQQMAVHQEKEVHKLGHRFGEAEYQPLHCFILEILVVVPTFIVIMGVAIVSIHDLMPWEHLSLRKRVDCIVFVLLITVCLFFISVYGLLIANRIRGYLEDRNGLLIANKICGYLEDRNSKHRVAVDGDMVV